MVRDRITQCPRAINKTVIFNDKIQYNEELAKWRIETIENVSEASLESCVETICGDSMFTTVFHTIQYSPKAEKVYFYVKGKIETGGWNNDYLENNVFSESLEDIKNICLKEKSKCADDISLHDINKLLHSQKDQLWLKKNQIKNMINAKINAIINLPDNIFVCTIFGLKPNELSVSLHKKSKNSSSKKIDECIFYKENGQIKKPTTSFGQILFNNISKEISLAFDIQEEVDYFYNNGNKKDIKSVNSQFYLDVFCLKSTLFISPKRHIPRSLFRVECNEGNYEYHSKSSNVIDIVSENEKDIFKRIFFKINDLPEWMQDKLYKTRQNQLAEEQKNENKQKKFGIKRKILSFLKK